MKHKSFKCLNNSYTAFLSGDPDLAIRSLKIAFNHVTNHDWTPVDVQRILRTLSWLYFYEGRFDKAGEQLEDAVSRFRRSAHPDKQNLSYLYYNLAECYRRQNRIELCKINFLAALDLLESSVGIDHKSFILLKQRYLDVCVNCDEQVGANNLQDARSDFKKLLSASSAQSTQYLTVQAAAAI